MLQWNKIIMLQKLAQNCSFFQGVHNVKLTLQKAYILFYCSINFTLFYIFGWLKIQTNKFQAIIIFCSLMHENQKWHTITKSCSYDENNKMTRNWSNNNSYITVTESQSVQKTPECFQICSTQFTTNVNKLSCVKADWMVKKVKNITPHRG